MDLLELAWLISLFGEEPDTIMLLLMIAIAVVTIGAAYMFFTTHQPKYIGFGVGIDVIFILVIWAINRYLSRS